MPSAPSLSISEKPCAAFLQAGRLASACSWQAEHRNIHEVLNRCSNTQQQMVIQYSPVMMKLAEIGDRFTISAFSFLKTDIGPSANCFIAPGRSFPAFLATVLQTRASRSLPSYWRSQRPLNVERDHCCHNRYRRHCEQWPLLRCSR